MFSLVLSLSSMIGTHRGLVKDARRGNGLVLWRASANLPKSPSAVAAARPVLATREVRNADTLERLGSGGLVLPAVVGSPAAFPCRRGHYPTTSWPPAFAPATGLDPRRERAEPRRPRGRRRFRGSADPRGNGSAVVLGHRFEHSRGILRARRPARPEPSRSSASPEWPQTVEASSFRLRSGVRPDKRHRQQAVRLQVSRSGEHEGVALQLRGTDGAGMRHRGSRAPRAASRRQISSAPPRTRRAARSLSDHMPSDPCSRFILRAPRRAPSEAKGTPDGRLGIVRRGQGHHRDLRPHLVVCQRTMTRADGALAKAVVGEGGPVGLRVRALGGRRTPLVTRTEVLPTEDGRFVTFLRPGSQRTLIASLDGRRLYGRHTMVVPDADDSEVEIAIAGGQTVSGQVVDRATRKGISGATLDVRPRSRMSEMTRLMLPQPGTFQHRSRARRLPHDRHGPGLPTDPDHPGGVRKRSRPSLPSNSATPCGSPAASSDATPRRRSLSTAP